MEYEKIQQKIFELICSQFVVDEASISNDTSFVDDLGADSLDIVELTMAIEEEFSLPEVTDDELKKIATVGDLVEYVNKNIEE